MRWLLVAAVTLSAAGLTPSVASADDRAIAQQAFQEGRDLMAASRVAEACPKFAAAAQLSQTPGVRLNLSDCYAKLGKTASAWAKANEALSLAERAGDSTAASVAHQRMAALEPKLSYLTIVVAKENAPQGLEVALDGETIPSAVWGTALPVDPGMHEVTARAPGRKPSSTRTTMTGEGARETVSVPVALAPEENPAGPSRASPLRTDATQADAETSGGGWSRQTAHTLALATGGLGVVGLGIGAVFGLDANSKKLAYEQHQANGRCIDEQCVTLSKDAAASALASTIAFAVGGALVTVGAVLWLTAPTSRRRDAEGRGVALAPMADSQSAGVGILGSW
jgi:serine/threonine-protein kinase